MEKSNELIQCQTCNATFTNNPNKHQYRQKYCPNCKTPYKQANTYIPTIFRHINIKQPLQKIYSFFTNKTKKTIIYQCPNCNWTTNTNNFKIRKYPDKTKKVLLNNQIQLIPITWKHTPQCPQCETNLIRKSKIN